MSVVVVSACRSSARPPQPAPETGAHARMTRAESLMADIQQPEDPVYRYRIDPVCRALIDSARMEVVGVTTVTRARDCAYRIDQGVRHLQQVVARNELRRQGRLVMDIPEFHDEQRLPADVAPQLGPLAGIYASPQLGEFSHLWQFTSHTSPGLLVGWIVVMQEGSEVLPQSYKNLHLAFGVNCIFLDANGTEADGSPQYTATIVRPRDLPMNPPEKRTQDVCREEDGSIPGTTVGTLKVIGKALPAGFTQADMVPAARFLEDGQGRTVFGLPCLNEWCLIGLTGFTESTQTFCDWFPAGTVPCPTNREGRIASWFDEQLLETRGPGNTWVATDIRAAIVPEPMLHTRPPATYTDADVLVAKLYISKDPLPNTRLWRAGVRKGLNEVYLVNGVTSGRMWEYKFKAITNPLNAGELALPWKVLGPHRHYDAPLPGTTRFRVTATDPGIWAPCGQYCCDSDAIS